MQRETCDIIDVTARKQVLRKESGGEHLSTKIFMCALLSTDLKCSVKMPSTKITCIPCPAHCLCSPGHMARETIFKHVVAEDLGVNLQGEENSKGLPTFVENGQKLQLLGSAARCQ